jgi:hypothetical protein
MGCDSALLLMQQKRSKLVFLRVAWIIEDGIGGGAEEGVPLSKLGYRGTGRAGNVALLSLFYLSYSRWPDVSLTPRKSLPAAA